MLTNPHQRVGATSNAHVGAEFERIAAAYFSTNQIHVVPNYRIAVGLHVTKQHAFDLGSDSPKIIVECKSHRWTSGNKVPSAKMTTWNEAMFYFHLAPSDYRKIFFVLHHKRDGSGESLVGYYRRIYAHLIPVDVEFIEWDEKAGKVVSA